MDKRFVRELVKSENPILFEVGCADGLDTLEFIEIFDDTNFQMFCFEPDYRNIMNFYSRIKDPRVRLFEGVIGNQTGEIDFFSSTRNYANGEELIYSSSLREPGEALFNIWPKLFDKSCFRKVKTRSITLDKFVNEYNIDYIDFMWLDVQGCEDLVIESGKNTFLSKVHYLYTEYSNQEIYIGEPNLDKILELLSDYSIVNQFPNTNPNGDLLGGDVLLKNNLL